MDAGAGELAMNIQRSIVLLLAFAVLPVCAQPGTNAPPALAPVYGEIPPSFWEQHGAMMVVAGLVFVALLAWLMWKLLQPKPARQIPPAVLAREALAKLRSRPEDGMLLSEVSQILRRYVGAAVKLPNGELTTAEFCAVIAGNKALGAELSQKIFSFLRECDVRKFSPANAAAPVDAVPRALELVVLIESAGTELERPDVCPTTR